jgi:putative flippase GtrA
LAEHVNEGLRYLVMTGISAAMSLGIPFVLHEGLAVRPDIAVAIGLGTAFLVNFTTAKLYVFKRRGFAKAQFGRFALVSTFFRLCEYIAFLVLHNLLGIQYMIANTSVLLFSFAMKFFVYKGFVFAHREPRLGKAGSQKPTRQAA